jgi:hypothetical protein
MTNVTAPLSRGCIDLIGKDAYGSRDRNTFGGEKGKLAFPIETRRLSTIASRIGERADDLQLLNDRPGPPLRDDDRQSIRIFRADRYAIAVDL